MDLKSLIEAGRALQEHTRVARRALDRLRAIDTHAQAALDKLVRENEPLRRQIKLEPKQGKALLADLRAERLAERDPAAAVALYQVSRVAELETAVREFSAAARRDVSRTWTDDALDHVTADGMLTRALLAETMRAHRGAELRAAAPGVRLAEYRKAVQNRLDPRSGILAEIIESICEDGTGATTPIELPKQKELRDIVEFFQTSRVPKEMGELADAIEAAKKLQTQLERADVRPANPDHDLAARAAYDREISNEAE